MILCDREIKELCVNQKMITPFDEKYLNPNSLDITVGFDFKLLASGNLFIPVDLTEYSKKKPYYLQRNDRGLLSTRETFNIPDGVCCEFKLKSSRAREFYNHLLAGWIDSGYSEALLTLEIKNESYEKLPIYPGFRIGQIVFFRSNKPELSYQKTGRYNNSQEAVTSKG